MELRQPVLELVERMTPLLRSICREISERETDLMALEWRARNPRIRQDRADRLEMAARIARHTRELVEARRELERLGCAIVSESPIVLGITLPRSGSEDRVLWQYGEVPA